MADMDREALVTLGEMRGQLREVVHTQNNLGMKLDAVFDKMTGRLDSLNTRLEALEADLHRRQGQNGVITMIIKSPAIAWLMAAAAGTYAFLTGKVHP